MGKKGKANIFENFIASNLTRQWTPQIDNAHLDRSRCWQHFQEATKKNKNKSKKKTYLTVSWKKHKALRLFSEEVVIQTLDFFF